MKPSDLTPREGKTLRYYVGRTKDGATQTPTDACIVEAVWSDLPHTHFEATTTVSSLKASKLLKRNGEGWQATPAGIKLIDAANKANVWQQAPKPSVTNNPEHIDPVLKDFKSKTTTRKTRKRGKK